MDGSQFTFRLAGPADADAVRELVRAAYAKWVPVIGREPRPMTADYARAVIEHQVELAFEGERLVGLIETEIRDDHFWIENIAVRVGEQGKGLGRVLLARAEDKARLAGQRELRLLTNGLMDVNIALYERVGYAITRTEPFMGGTAVYMGKTLGK
jgi:GNAT superfamily N-acetyltransferase